MSFEFERRSLLFLFFSLGLALLAGFLTSHYSNAVLLLAVAVVAMFVVTFIDTEAGLYMLIFSMLLSPELGVGQLRGAGTLERGVTLRLDDFLLVIIGISWLAKNAVHKQLGLFLRTPLNRPIFFYVAACAISTGLGIIWGRVEAKTGFFYVLKYAEYFIVFFMVANHLESRAQIKRFLFCLFLTCLITSVIGILQIPGGGRVSAPFEGQRGEPNTFGGYLLLIGSIAAGLLVQGRGFYGSRRTLVGLLVFIIPPFLFTESRSSYLGFFGASLAFGLMMQKRALMIGALTVGLLVSPVIMPSQVKDRILYTVSQREHPGQHITIGQLRLDTSTSVRIRSWQQAIRDWTRHPLTGYGVTGYHFVDAQIPRVLVESGVIGLAAFVYLMVSIFKLALANLRKLEQRDARGLMIGFISGFVGLLCHSIGANTFIIVRIMEPFWFLTGIIAVLPAIEAAEAAAPTAPGPPRQPARPVTLRRRLI